MKKQIALISILLTLAAPLTHGFFDWLSSDDEIKQSTRQAEEDYDKMTKGMHVANIARSFIDQGLASEADYPPLPQMELVAKEFINNAEFVEIFSEITSVPQAKLIEILTSYNDYGQNDLLKPELLKRCGSEYESYVELCIVITLRTLIDDALLAFNKYKTQFTVEYFKRHPESAPSNEL